VQERVVSNRSAELARKDGAAKLQAWMAQPDAAKMAPALVVSRDAPQTISPKVLDKIMFADTSKLPAWAGVDLGAQGYAVVRVNKVLERTAVEEARAKQERAQYAQWVASAENQAYYELLKSRYKVQVKTPKPVNATNALALTE
jgi:peptidyl-prolyl cis-trans isomerase D